IEPSKGLIENPVDPADDQCENCGSHQDEHSAALQFAVFGPGNLVFYLVPGLNNIFGELTHPIWRLFAVKTLYRTAMGAVLPSVHGWRDSNSQPTVLETATLPIELHQFLDSSRHFQTFTVSSWAALRPLEPQRKPVNPKGLQRYTEIPEKKSVPENIIRNAIPLVPSYLVQNFRHLARANGAATFADSEAETFLHSDLVDQLNFDRYVVARHNHFIALGQLHFASNVRGPEVELRAVL